MFTLFYRNRQLLILTLILILVCSDLAPIRITLDLVKSSAIKLQPFFWLLSVK